MPLLHVILGQHRTDDTLILVPGHCVQLIEDLHTARAHHAFEAPCFSDAEFRCELEHSCEEFRAFERIVHADAEPIPGVLQRFTDDPILDAGTRNVAAPNWHLTRAESQAAPPCWSFADEASQEVTLLVPESVSVTTHTFTDGVIFG